MAAVSETDLVAPATAAVSETDLVALATAAVGETDLVAPATEPGGGSSHLCKTCPQGTSTAVHRSHCSQANSPNSEVREIGDFPSSAR